MNPGDYKGKTKSAQLATGVTAGFRATPVHVPASSTNFEVCPAGSVMKVLSINVTSSAGVNEFFQDSNGNKQFIMVGALTARDYHQYFYCPWPVYVSTDVDVTCFVYAPAKNTTVD